MLLRRRCLIVKNESPKPGKGEKESTRRAREGELAEDGPRHLGTRGQPAGCWLVVEVDAGEAGVVALRALRVDREVLET